MKLLKWIWLNVFWDKEGGGHWSKEEGRWVVHGDMRPWGVIILIFGAIEIAVWRGWM